MGGYAILPCRGSIQENWLELKSREEGHFSMWRTRSRFTSNAQPIAAGRDEATAEKSDYRHRRLCTRAASGTPPSIAVNLRRPMAAGDASVFLDERHCPPRTQ